jgi:calcineurin-like phosphoesterase family protein
MAPDSTLTFTPHNWDISDTHFFHENIGRFCNRTENWQGLISPDDTVLRLGDFALRNKSIFELLTRLLTGNLLLIRGKLDWLNKT